MTAPAPFGALGELALGEFGSPVSAISTGFEMFLSGAWVDVSSDVRHDPHPRMHRGIQGTAPTDRQAMTGTLSFTLDNSIGNSAGLLGYYSPDHANLRTGFGIGTKVRWFIRDTYDVNHYKFYGRIVSITVEPGAKLGRGVAVEAVDYMDYLADTNLQRMALQVSKRPDEIIDTVIDSLPIAPLATNYATSPYVLSYGLHVDRDEKTTAMSAMQKVLQSDLGYLFVSGDVSGGETLTYQSRTTRLDTTTPAADLDDTMTGLVVRHMKAQVYNDIRVIVHPVRLDTLNTTVLASAQSEFSIAAAATLVLTMRYRDPSGAFTRVSGTDMIPPANGTDYEFTATAGSGNNDLTGLVAVSVDFGVNSAEVTLTNNHTATAYSGGNEVFQLRGRGIYPYDPVELTATDATSITAYGRQSLTFDMPYQGDINIGQTIADDLLARFKDPASDVESVTFSAERSDTFHDYAAQLDIGNRVTITETVTGIDTDFFINAVAYELIGPDTLFVTWLLEPVLVAGEYPGGPSQPANPAVWGTGGDEADWGPDGGDTAQWS